jgi:polyisoprenoid-binding protein YceI
MFMKLNLNLAAIAAAALLALNAGAETIRYQASPGSKVKLDGTSTIHDWTVEGGILGGFIEMDSNFPLDPSKPSTDLKVTPKVEVNVPVRSLKSGKKPMDDIMHDALKVKDHATIKYTLKELKPKARKAGEPLKFDAKGDLTVAGVTKPVGMEVTMEPMAGNKLKSSGVAEVKMTDFGIKPPSPSITLGLIKTADEVKITFEWITVRRDATQASVN